MLKLVFLILTCSMLPAALHGQYRMPIAPDPVMSAPYESDILAARPIRYFLGAGIGAMWFQHKGDFLPDPEVCDCVFSDLDDARFHYAGEFSIQYPKLGFALKFLLQYYEFSGVFQYRTELSTILQGDNQNVLIEYEKTSNVELSYISFTPGFAYYIPRSQAFILGGIDVGVPLEKKYDNLESVLTPGYTYDSLGTQFEYTFLEKSDIPDVPAIRIGLMFALGYDIMLTERLYATPQIGATIPLTSVSDRHPTWKVMSEYALLILKYRL